MKQLFNLSSRFSYFRILPYFILCLGMTTKVLAQDEDPLQYDRMLCVKFRNDLPIYVDQGRLTDRGNNLPGPLASLADAGVYSKLIENMSDETLDNMRFNAQKFWDAEARKNPALKPGIMADMNTYFVLRLYNGVDKEDVIRQLKASALVEYVSIRPKPVAPPTPGNYEGNQTYLNNDHGINAKEVYSAYNNRGAGVRVVDIEYGFNANHVDLPRPIQVVNGTYLGGKPEFSDHGTAVLGEMVSLNNGWGTTGIASASTPLFAGVINGNNEYNIENAILNAVYATQPGDVILIEQQVGGYYFGSNCFNSKDCGYMPVEYYKATYDAIKMAVGNNRIVIEAAGNGYQNLDDPNNSKGYEGHNPFIAANHSGAIMVGAGCSGPNGTSAPRSRRDFSNYGSRLDVQAFGERVWTTGLGGIYKDEGPNSEYWSSFGGTSSASPIVAGACLLVQSVYKSKFNGSVLSPLQMRSLLVSTGKPQQNGTYPVSQKIGPLPNAFAAIQSALNVNTCAAPTTAQLSATNITATSVRLNCAVSGVQVYDWVYRKIGTSAWTELPGGTGNFTDVTGLTANTQYEFSAIVRCNATVWSAWSPNKSFTTSNATLSNDQVCNAASLTASGSCSYSGGSNVGATASSSATVCGTNSPKDVWFKCPIPSSGIVTFRTAAGSLDDAIMAVYWGSSCSGLTYIACEDDNGDVSAMPVMAITGQPGTMLWVRVWGYENTTGTFSICALNYNSGNRLGGNTEKMAEVVYAIDINPLIADNIGVATEAMDMPIGNTYKTTTSDRSNPQERFTAEAGDLFPNPAMEQVMIPYTLVEYSTVRITVYDVLGRVAQSQTLEQESGTYQAVLNLNALTAGAYLVRFQSGSLVRVQPLQVAR